MIDDGHRNLLSFVFYTIMTHFPAAVTEQKRKRTENMNFKETVIKDRKCLIRMDQDADTILIQPVDDHDTEELEKECEAVSEASIPYTLVTFPVKDWNRELSPWPAEAVFKGAVFAGGAEETLQFIKEDLLPYLSEEFPEENRRHLIIGGYSLAGLFALWTVYETDLFEAVTAASPSVWFAGWDDYISSHPLKAEHVYLSLGTKEEKTRNPVMASVGDRIRMQYDILNKAENCSCILEWNPGNHFRDSGMRTGKGFAWCLKQIKKKNGAAQQTVS